VAELAAMGIDAPDLEEYAAMMDRMSGACGET